jgi:LuxR family maltose regulon positive regulatory protein
LLLDTGSGAGKARARKLLAKVRGIGNNFELLPVLQAIDDLENQEQVDALTVREVDVLVRIAHGSSNSGIADDLNISYSTVATHLRNIFRKIDAANRTEAANYARHADLLDEH